MENQNTTTPILSAPKPRLSKAQQAVGVAAFVLLAVSLFFGYTSGVARARSLDTYHSVDALNTALGYYFKDEAQYPTQQQFQNQDILTISYLTMQPQPSDVAGVCSDDTAFTYSRPSAQTFQLQFCLEQGVKGLSAGEHVLTPSGVQ